MNVQGFELLSNDALRHASSQFLDQQPHTQRSSGSVKVWKLTFSLPSRDGSELTTALRVVPAGVLFRGPDISLEMQLFAVSVQTEGSDGSESMAECLSEPLV